MKKSILRFTYKILKKLAYFFGFSSSFSSDGEDYALHKLLNGISEGKYIDIGSNHPIKHSNTFSFYLLGWSGVCIDPIPFLDKQYKIFRNGDVFINAGVIGKANNNAAMDFYYFKDYPDNSTFDVSRVEALRNEFNRHPTSITAIPIITFAEVWAKFNDKWNGDEIHLLNLDTEGDELNILHSIFSLKVNPWVICVKDLGYSASTVMSGEIHQLLHQRGYILVSRTFMSSIYVREDITQNLLSPYIRDLKLRRLNG